MEQFFSERGQGLVEYALIIALISITVIALLTAISGNISSIFGSITNTINAEITSIHTITQML